MKATPGAVTSRRDVASRGNTGRATRRHGGRPATSIEHGGADTSAAGAAHRPSPACAMILCTGRVIGEHRGSDAAAGRRGGHAMSNFRRRRGTWARTGREAAATLGTVASKALPATRAADPATWPGPIGPGPANSAAHDAARRAARWATHWAVRWSARWAARRAARWPAWWAACPAATVVPEHRCTNAAAPRRTSLTRASPAALWAWAGPGVTRTTEHCAARASGACGAARVTRAPKIGARATRACGIETRATRACGIEARPAMASCP